MARVMYMPEAEIQKLEASSSSGIAAWIMQEGTHKSAEKFMGLLRSYRIAAHVANACWALVDDLRAGSGIQPATWERVITALHDYAPNNFPPHAGHVEYAMNVLEALYDRASKAPTREAAVEEIFQWAQELRKSLP